MNKYYVYILKSSKGRHYIGYTSNLPQRLVQHNRKHKGFTSREEHWEVEFFVECSDKMEAVNLESKLKSFKNSTKALEYLQKNSTF